MILGKGLGLFCMNKPKNLAPDVTSEASADISNSSANISAIVKPGGLPTTVTIQYGLTNSYGSTIIATQSPVNGYSDVPITATITGLSIYTTYYWRIKVNNSLGETYTVGHSFRTSSNAPIISSEAADSITDSGAQITAYVNPIGESTVVTVEYGETNSYGSSVACAESPITGETNILVSSELSGLTPNTTYHWRIKAVNSVGTAYSSDHNFTSDIDKTFVMKVTLNNGNTLEIPMVTGYNYDFTIDWGDGSALSTINAYDDADRFHTYITGGTYLVKLLGTCEAIRFNTAPNSYWPREIVQWGDLGFKNLEGAFMCYYLTKIPAGVMSMPLCTNFKQMFSGSGLTMIPTSIICSPSVTDMTRMFYACVSMTGIAPNLWDIYPSVLHTYCFYVCSGLSNYNAIPAGWK